MTKNPSLYFENTEMFIQMHLDHAPLAVLMNAIKANGCPDAMVDEIVNGAIVQELNRIVTPKETTVSIYQDGREALSVKPYNPTPEELIDDTVSRFEGLEAPRAKAIVDFLISKKALTVNTDGRLYRTMALIPRQPVSI